MTGQGGSTGREDERAAADEQTAVDLEAARAEDLSADDDDVEGDPADDEGDRDGIRADDGAVGEGADETAELPSPSPAFTESSASGRSEIGGAGRVRGRVIRSTKVTEAMRGGALAGGEQLQYIDDPSTRIWVGIIVATFAAVFLYALLLGNGGFLTPTASPAPEPTESPVVSASPSAPVSASPSASASGSASPSASTSPSPSASASGAVSPAPSGSPAGSPSASASAGASPSSSGSAAVSATSSGTPTLSPAATSSAAPTSPAPTAS